MTPSKVAITGHSAGIGQALYQHFLNKGHKVIGYDLTNGYDLNKDVNLILSESRDCDLFINNAFCNQIEIAQKWFKLHQNRPYTLINISSTITDCIIKTQLLKKYPELENYIGIKTELNNTSTNINVASKQARSIVIKSGFVDTNFVTNFEQQLAEYFPDSTFVKDFNSLKERSSLQSADQIVRAVDYALQDTSGYVTEVTLDNPIHILSLCK